MKMLVNATTCVIGGGIQVASSFISQAIENSDGCSIIAAVSSKVKENLNSLEVRDNRIYELTSSPAKLWNGLHTRKRQERQLVNIWM